MTDPTRLQEIRERLSKATPWPWVQTHMPGSHQIYAEPTDANFEYSGEWIAECAVTTDQDFIANAPSDIQYLLDLLAERDRQVGVLRKALNHALGKFNAAIDDPDYWLRACSYGAQLCRKALEDVGE